MRKELSTQEAEVIARQVSNKKEDIIDLQTEIEEIDLHLNKLLVLYIKRRTEKLKADRQEKQSQMQALESSIKNMEDLLTRGYYEEAEPTEETKQKEE